MSDLARRLQHAATQVPLTTTRVGQRHTCVGGTHTRLSDGRQLCWAPSVALAGSRYAADAELLAQAVPRALGRRSGVSDPTQFWRLWTRAEARAKLRDVPILEWIATVDWTHDADRRDESHPGAGMVEVVTVVGDGLVVSYAALAAG